MTTLLISENFPPKTGGSARWFWELYNRLPREDYIIAAGEDPQQEAFDRTHDMRVVRVPLTLPDWGVFSLEGFKSYRKLFQPVSKILKSHGIEKIHCGRSLPEGWVAWMLKQRYGLPYVCYVHGEEVNLISSGIDSGLQSSRQLRSMTKRVLLGAEMIIANSRNTESILINKWQISSQKLHILYPGVDTVRFFPVDRDQQVRKFFDWGNRLVLLTVGRLQKRKGQDMMIRALHEVRKVFPDLLYAIVGDGEERSSLEELVKEEGLERNVQFMGEVDDSYLIQCYQQCDLFVLPNRQVGSDIEGFGMVLLEAQACGKPVIAGASGGTAETMQTPETGRTILCDVPNELAKAVLELLRDPDLRSGMGKAARQWVLDQFDWDTLSLQAIRIFGQASTSHNK